MPYQSWSLLQLQARLSTRFEGSAFWTAEESRLVINEALRLWNAMTGMWARRLVIPTVASQVWYPLSASLTFALRIAFDGRLMDPASLFDLDNQCANWEGQTTASAGAPTRPIAWAPAGLRLLAIWPADAVGQHSLMLDGIAATPQLALPTDTLDLGDAHLEALLGYALHILSFKQGAETLQETAPLLTAFRKAALDQNDRLAHSASFRRFIGLDQRRSLQPIRTGEAIEGAAAAGALAGAAEGGG